MSKEIKIEILNYVMKDVDDKTFQTGIDKGSFQFIYERHRNHLVSNFFNGDVLRYAITLSELFSPFNKDTLRLKDLNDNIKVLSEKIRLSKKWNGCPAKRLEMINDYNFLLTEFNEKSKPAKKIISKYLKQSKNERGVSKL